MTSKLQRLNINGEQIWVEVEELTTDVPAQKKITNTSNSASDAVKNASQQLVGADISPTLSSILRPVQQALVSYGLIEATIELALGIKGEVGFFLAKGEGNASLKITAKWKP